MHSAPRVLACKKVRNIFTDHNFALGLYFAAIVAGRGHSAKKQVIKFSRQSIG